MVELIKTLLNLFSVHIHIHWVSGHQSIYNNEKAHETAKYDAEWCDSIPRPPLLYSFLRELKLRTPEKWKRVTFSVYE